MAARVVPKRVARGLLPLCALACCVQAQAFPGDQWQQAGKAHGVDPILLYAVALAESATPRGSGQVGPWPYALRKGAEAHYPGDAQSAAVLLATLLNNESARTLDIGLMQINLHWHGHRVDSPAALLDGKSYLNVGAEILADAINDKYGGLDHLSLSTGLRTSKYKT